MDTIKKFIKYFLIFIAIYAFVSFFSVMYLTGSYENVNVEILTESPRVDITEVKATYVNGKIIGSITNNTGEYIQTTYLKIDCYSDTNYFIDAVYIDIHEFGTNEVKEFEESFGIKDIDSIKLSIVDTKPIEDNQRWRFNEDLLGLGLLGLVIVFIL